MVMAGEEEGKQKQGLIYHERWTPATGGQFATDRGGSNVIVICSSCLPIRAYVHVDGLRLPLFLKASSCVGGSSSGPLRPMVVALLRSRQLRWALPLTVQNLHRRTHSIIFLGHRWKEGFERYIGSLTLSY